MNILLVVLVVLLLCGSGWGYSSGNAYLGHSGIGLILIVLLILFLLGRL